MNPWSAGIAAAFVMAGVAGGAGDSGLPDFQAGERAGQAAAGAPLTGQDPLTAAEPLDIVPPSAEDLATTIPPMEELPGKYWSAYFGERPQALLVDPQGLLNSADTRDRLAFLNLAADSAIDLVVYLFKGNQELPGQVRAEESIERLFSGGRATVLVYYFLGVPQRAVLHLSPCLTDVVSAAEQRQTLESSVTQASAKTDPSAQFEAFLVQMSVRMDRMERMMGGSVKGRDGLAEHGKKGKIPEKKPSFLEKLRPYLEQAAWFWIPAAVALGLLLAGWLAGACLKRRVRYLLPVVIVEPRLGGDHAAGVGAVISFANAAVSLTSQRDQL